MKLKCVLLSDYHPKDILGGGGAIAFEFHEILLKLGHESRFWFTSTHSSNHIFERGFRAKTSKMRLVRYSKQVIGTVVSLKIFFALCKERPDVVWVHQIGNSISHSILWWLRLVDIKTIVTLHDFLVISKTKIGVVDPTHEEISAKFNIDISSQFHERLRRSILTKYVNTACQIFTVSTMQQQILRSYGINSLMAIPNGVQPCEHKPTESNSQRTQDYNVLFAGRFHRKGLECLIEGLKNSSDNWKLHIAGDSQLLAYAEKNLPSNRYVFYGRVSRDQLHLLMHKMDLVSVLSQYFDPYPTIGLEAIRHGSFFITTSTSGVATLLEDLEPRLNLKVGEIPNLDVLLSIVRELKTSREILMSRIPTQESVAKLYIDQVLGIRG